MGSSFIPRLPNTNDVQYSLIAHRSGSETAVNV